MLMEAGCPFIRHGKGDHEVWFSPISSKHFPVDGTIKSRHTANAGKTPLYICDVCGNGVIIAISYYSPFEY